MNEGDRVRLKMQIGMYYPGSEGVIDFMPAHDEATVYIDLDENGKNVDPPQLTPPVNTFKLEVI